MLGGAGKRVFWPSFENIYMYGPKEEQSERSYLMEKRVTDESLKGRCHPCTYLDNLTLSLPWGSPLTSKIVWR